MNIKDFSRSKFLFGIYFENDYSYNVKKGEFFNKVRRYFKTDSLLLISDPIIGDNLINEKNNIFKLTTKESSLHFEENSTKEEFIERCNRLFEIHQSIFDTLEINKIGFVQYFEITKPNCQIDFLRSNYFKNIPNIDMPLMDFHVNFKKPLGDFEYNFNLTLNQDNFNKKTFGALDMNISKSELVNLDNSNITLIFNDLDHYYISQFANEFFNIHG